ncbi:AAA family ATPase [Vibrio splendidus]
MKLNIRNLGKIKQAEIELKDLTIICGPNSSNKTWLSYLISNMLTTIYERKIKVEMSKEIDDFAKNILEHGEASIALDTARPAYLEYLQTSIRESKETLPNYFKADKESLLDLKFELDISSFSDRKATVYDWTSKTTNVKFSYNDNKIFAHALPHQGEDETFERRLNHVLFCSILFIGGLVSNYTFMRPHIVSSERTGALMFQPEMDRSTILIDEVMRGVGNLDISSNEKSRFIGDLLGKLYSEKSRLPTPVNDNVQDIRDIAKAKENNSVISETNPEVLEILDKINGGNFVLDENEIRFVQKDNGKSYSIGSTSSSIKSIFLIDLIIRHKIDKGEIILIDEPELNLHPDNQRLMARLIIRLINAGVKVLITTHSDFLIREINNAIALNNDFDDKDEFLKENDLASTDILDGERVSAYSVDREGIVETMAISKFGIETAIFDNLINKANNLQDDILYKIEPSLFED